MSYLTELKLLGERQAEERRSLAWRHGGEQVDLAIEWEGRDDPDAKSYMDGVREALARRR